MMASTFLNTRLGSSGIDAATLASQREAAVSHLLDTGGRCMGPCDMARAIPLNRSRVCFLLASLALAVAACTTKPLVDPRPLAAHGTPEQTRVVILRALLENDWAVESEKPGAIVARYGGPGWNMVVGIEYADQISIHYVSSENLDYETGDDGTTRIHRGYNARVRRLSQEIGKEIMSASVIESLPPVAAPPVAEPPSAETEPE